MDSEVRFNVKHELYIPLLCTTHMTINQRVILHRVKSTVVFRTQLKRRLILS